MARAQLDVIRLGPTTLTGSGGAQTVGQVACSTLTAGMANGTQMYVRVLVTLFDNVSGTAYAAMFWLTAPILLTAGPTYTIGTASLTSLNAVGAGPTYSVATLDISGGNLRVRITPGSDNVDSMAVVETFVTQ